MAVKHGFLPSETLRTDMVQRRRGLGVLDPRPLAATIRAANGGQLS